ncbi:MAG TPA: hypothetical protein VFM07_05555 [Intrasporangium sp.]|nr:hypothetical protein [Intrasporangium sp.]
MSSRRLPRRPRRGQRQTHTTTTRQVRLGVGDDVPEGFGSVGLFEVGEADDDDGGGAAVVAGLLGEAGRGVPVGVIRSVGRGDMEGSAGSGRVGRGAPSVATWEGAEGAVEEYGPGSPAPVEASDVGDVDEPTEAPGATGAALLGPLVMADVTEVRSDQSSPEPVCEGGADRVLDAERPAMIQPVRRVTSSAAPSTAGVTTRTRRRR